MDIQNNLKLAQQEICQQHGVPFCPSPKNHKVGISFITKNNNYPINGLRYTPNRDTTGWFIWQGEESPGLDDDYFLPLHVSHLLDCCPEIIIYLGLPPGWRFLIAPGYIDVWFDKNLLKI